MRVYVDPGMHYLSLAHMSEDTSLVLVDEKIDVGRGEPPLLPSLIKTKTAVACASRTSKLFVVSRNKVHMDRTFLLIALPTAKCCIDQSECTVWARKNLCGTFQRSNHCTQAP